MKARPKKPSARGTAAKKSAVGRAAVARKANVTAKPARSAAAKAAGTANAKSAVAKAGKAAKPAKATSKHTTAALGADCTIEHAPGLQKQLGKVLTDRACVTLDFSAVKRCDTAGLQVLAAFIRERREAGREVELASMSGNFLATVKLLGLTALFTQAEGHA